MMIRLLCSLFIFLNFSTSIASDHLVFIGTAIGKFTVTGAIEAGAYDETTHTLDASIYAEDTFASTICDSYKAAMSKGLKVTMLIGANLKCKDGTLIKSHPDCAIHSCSEDVIKKALKSKSKSIKKGDSLILQTAAHGEPKTGDLFLEGAGGGTLTKKEIAAALNDSGISARVKKINGVFFQCYSGHHNDLGELLRPKVRFCSISQAKPSMTAVQKQKKGRSNENSTDSFTQSVWGNYTKGSGMNFLSAGAQASTTNFDSGDIHRSTLSKWGISSLALARNNFKEKDIENSLVDEDQSLFGVNDDRYNTGSKARWEFQNDFKSLRAPIGNYIQTIMQKSFANNLKQLDKIDSVSKSWEKQYENLGMIDTLKSKKDYYLSDVRGPLSKKEELNQSAFHGVSSDQYQCLSIEDDLKIDDLASVVDNSVAKKLFDSKQKEMNKLLSSRRFRENLNKCFSRLNTESVEEDPIYKKFSQNEKLVYNELNGLMERIKKEVRLGGSSQSEVLNSEVSVSKLSFNEPQDLGKGNYSTRKYESFKLEKDRKTEKMTYKEAIKYYKSFLSKNYSNTEKNISERDVDQSFKLMKCKEMQEFAPALAEMNTLKKMNDIYKEIKDPNVKREYINKVLCEMGY